MCSENSFENERYYRSKNFNKNSNETHLFYRKVVLTREFMHKNSVVARKAWKTAGFIFN